MVEIRWMQEKPFRQVAVTTADDTKAALELVRSVYPEAKLVEQDDSYRVTARSAGGRPGLNVAYIEETF